MEPDNNLKLTSRQKQVLPYLVGEPSVEEACKKAKISRETVYRWLKESPPFGEALRVQRDAVLTDSLERLKGAGDKAVTTLVTLLDSKQESIRERAAGRILDYLLKIREIEEIEDRLTSLEQNLVGRRHAAA